MSEKLLTCIRDGVLEITINRPEALNAFDADVHSGLDAIWQRFDADAGLRAAIVTGAGERAFSAGSDLKYYQSGAPIVLPVSGYGGLSHRRLSAAEAQRLGLVNEVVPRSALMATARRWAADILLGAPRAGMEWSLRWLTFTNL